MREIGSEFSFEVSDYSGNFIFPKQVKDFTLTFSGRTSIETVLKNEPDIKKVMLPSYCCQSMIDPFLELGIEVFFYNVYYSNGICIDMNIQEDIDAILWCNYFGFNVKMPDLTFFIHRGGIVIEDITHSFFSEVKYNSQSKYLVASLRKWEPILCGGYCASVNQDLKFRPLKKPSSSFINTRKEAMNLKADFLGGNASINKKEFLDKYTEANKWIAENYSKLCIDEESMNILNSCNYVEHYNRRINNAKTLYKGLKELKYVKPLFKESDMDCPLFVPIIVEVEQRDCIRKKLIENQIYCPIHWPKPNIECKSNLYEVELSLICDQRYDESDMERIITVMKEFENNLNI